jgi:hypothetical protein
VAETRGEERTVGLFPGSEISNGLCWTEVRLFENCQKLHSPTRQVAVPDCEIFHRLVGRFSSLFGP